TTAAYGGGIADYGALTLVDSVVASNGSRYGGGLFVGDGASLTATAAITHVSFVDNSAAQFGGRLYTNVNSTAASLENDLFADNHAGASGGGLPRTNAHLSISRSSFTANTAFDGGGLFLQGLPNPDSAGYVELRDSTVSSNTAASGHSGGIE